MMQDDLQPSQNWPTADEIQMFEKRNSDITEVVGLKGNITELNES